MAEDCPKPERPWRVIAEEVSKEVDPNKIAELSEELIEAIDRHTGQLAPMPNREEQQGPQGGLEVRHGELPFQQFILETTV